MTVFRDELLKELDRVLDQIVKESKAELGETTDGPDPFYQEAYKMIVTYKKLMEGL